MEASRLATLDDVAAIADLARRLRTEIVAFRGAGIWATREGRTGDLEAVYADLVDDDEVCVVVGTIDDVVLGFGVGEWAALHDGRRLGIVTDLYVDAEARAVGVGEAMVTMLLAHFEDLGCVGVDAWALPGDRNTKNFFEEHGFVARLIVAHKPLRPDDPLAGA